MVKSIPQVDRVVLTASQKTKHKNKKRMRTIGGNALALTPPILCQVTAPLIILQHIDHIIQLCCEWQT